MKKSIETLRSDSRLVQEYIDSIDDEEEEELLEEDSEEEEEEPEEVEDSDEEYEEDSEESIDDIEFVDEPDCCNTSEIYSVGNLKKSSAPKKVYNNQDRTFIDQETKQMLSDFEKMNSSQVDQNENQEDEEFWTDIDSAEETAPKTKQIHLTPPIPKVNEILEKKEPEETHKEVWDENNPKLKMLASLMTLYMRKGNLQSYFENSNPNSFYNEIFKINLMIVINVFEFLEVSYMQYSYANILEVYKNLLAKIQNIKGKEKKLKYLLVAVMKWKEKYSDRFSNCRTLPQVLTIFDSKVIKEIIAAQKPKISNDDLSGVMAVVFDQVLI